MIATAQEYLEHHGDDLIEAAAAFATALVGGDPSKPKGYDFDNAIMATVEAFELQPKELIRLVTRLTIKATT